MKQQIIHNTGILLVTLFSLLIQSVQCASYKILKDCPYGRDILEIDGNTVATMVLIKYPGSTGTRFQFYTNGFQKNHNICLYSDNTQTFGDFYNEVMEFVSPNGDEWAIRIGNTDNKTYLYYSFDVFHFSCEASDVTILPKVIFNYGGKSEAVDPLKYICKANNGFEKKKKRSVLDKKLESRSRVLAVDDTIM